MGNGIRLKERRKKKSQNAPVCRVVFFVLAVSARVKTLIVVSAIKYILYLHRVYTRVFPPTGQMIFLRVRFFFSPLILCS